MHRPADEKAQSWMALSCPLRTAISCPSSADHILRVLSSAPAATFVPSAETARTLIGPTGPEKRKSGLPLVASQSDRVVSPEGPTRPSPRPVKAHVFRRFAYPLMTCRRAPL